MSKLLSRPQVRLTHIYVRDFKDRNWWEIGENRKMIKYFLTVHFSSYCMSLWVPTEKHSPEGPPQRWLHEKQFHFVLKSLVMGLETWFRGYEPSNFLEHLVSIPASLWELTTTCQSSSRRFDALFWTLEAHYPHVVHINTFRWNTYIHTFFN